MRTIQRSDAAGAGVCVLHLLAVIYNLQVEWQCLERFIYKLICWHIPLED